ncbi:MAG: TIGR03560 family F420-dependent LLM class oxidoreductase [Microthrixaceae bacterium]|nr:TIGR03560 family F420-dependent LLM class oxidoreductase [Microthrixaceae bacterium]
MWEEPWTCAYSPSRNRVPATGTCWRWRSAPSSSGFSAFFRSDHYLKMGDVSGLPGPSDAWVTLAGLARDTSTIRLGTMVTAATFRLPGPLAVAVANVDDMSGGRVELGIGAGWYDEEHRNYGIPFPGLGERFDRLAEQLAIITGLWSTPEGATFDFDGDHYTFSDSPALPKPVQSPGPPVIVGGLGAKRTPSLVARYAQSTTHPSSTPARPRSSDATSTPRAEAIGRDPATVLRSACQVVCVADDRRSRGGPLRSGGTSTTT